MRRLVLSTRAIRLWFWICSFHTYTHTDTNADTHTDTYTNAYAYTNAYTNTYSYSDTYSSPSGPIQHRRHAQCTGHRSRQDAGFHRHLHHV
ncbi:MAG TPA: hypothetical protein VM578_02840 [Candidatus Saccharimonadales bacterium]|nr:hypothetical protein [Candidatus Saccharimonadales bacterium]